MLTLYFIVEPGNDFYSASIIVCFFVVFFLLETARNMY